MAETNELNVEDQLNYEAEKGQGSKEGGCEKSADQQFVMEGVKEVYMEKEEHVTSELAMPMMIMPGASLQPPQYGWVRQQQPQQLLVQQPAQPKPPSDPNPPGTFAPPPPPPPPDTPSTKPLFPGALNDSRPPPPPGGPDLSSPPPPPPASESKATPPKPPTPVAPPVSKSMPPSFLEARNLEGLSAPPPIPPPLTEDEQGDQGDSKWGRLCASGSSGQRENLGAPGDEGLCIGEDSEYDDGYGGGRSWNEADGETGSQKQSRWGEYEGCSRGALDGGSSGSGGVGGKFQDGGSSSSLSSGTWRCDGCQEINFDSRVECKRCGLIEVKERMNTLKKFGKMFDSWTESWKVSNQDNPDQDYVANYMAQMEAMRYQLLDKRKAIEWDPLLKPMPTARFGKRILEDEVVEQRGQKQVKRSRWEQDMDLDIESLRRPKQSKEDFWKPNAVKDCSQQGPPRRSKQEFGPSETFDYSQKGSSESVSTRSVLSLKNLPDLILTDTCQ